MIRSYLACVDLARPLLDVSELEARWEEPSPLERMTLGDLAAHLGRAVLTVADYLDMPSDASPVDAPAYYLALPGVRAPALDDDLATSVRERARRGAAAGPAGVREGWDRQREELGRRLPGVDGTRVVAVRGSALRLDDYLITRMVEVVVHSDDLAVGLGVPGPAFPEEAWSSVLDCLWQVARRSADPLAILRRMTRVERAAGDPLRVL
jgi:uncharacterized protein (TIGR03083 family)